MKSNGTDKQTLAICFGQFGPYHHARVSALQQAAAAQDVRVVPVQIAGATTTYEWKSKQGDGPGGVVSPPQAEDLRTLCEGIEEAASPFEVFMKARKLFREEKVEVAFLPSYSPARYFALFAAAKSLDIRTVMMNESHAGTEQAIGWKRWIKRQIVKRFDAALVGGEPHKRHFASLGIPSEKIFTGYDAVDNAFFAAKADEVRKKSDEWRVTSDELRGQDESSKDQETKRQTVREAYGLPERYFLSLGRMVEKKNLSTLVEAYARFARASVERSKAETGNLKPELPETADGGDAAATNAENCKLKTEHCPPGLVFVGSGELEVALREQAWSLGLRVVDRTDWKAGSKRQETKRLKDEETDDCKLNTENSVENDRGAVYFYGFRQIEENPVFYALAEAFVLPSLKEEWGLVVNEAMACSLPVIVSRTAGCAEDLLPRSESRQCSVGSIQSGEEKKTEDRELSTGDFLEQRSNGFVFDPSSVEALASALACVAEMEDQRSEMGRRSREIVAKFSCGNFARQAMRAAEATGAS